MDTARSEVNEGKASMKSQDFVKIVLTVGVSVLFSACAGQNNPVSETLVFPELDESGEMVNLFAADGDKPVTLMDAVLAQGVPAPVADAALKKYDQYSDVVRKTDYIAMIDFTQHSGRLRFYLVNRASGKVDRLAVAHGSGSDPDNDGMAQYFSNIPNSKMSSLGSYLIQERYVGKYGGSMRLDGLEPINSNVRDRAIVLHPSKYIKDGKAKQGRSWGCPAVPYSWIESIIDRTRDGTFMYAYGFDQRQSVNDAFVLDQWQLIPKSQWVNESEDAPIDGE